MTLRGQIDKLRAYEDVAAAWARRCVEHGEEIERLRAIIARIDAINDNPYNFNSEINRECDKVLRPELVSGY